VTGRTSESVAVVVVTYNRADMLERMLAGLEALETQPDAVYVVDNASTDHTRKVLDRATNAGLVPMHLDENLGGAGGFHAGLRAAHEAGFDRFWLMDDDVVPAPDCLTVLLAQDEACLMAVREDLDGHLVEKAAVRFDLRNPLSLRPKTASVESTYRTRAAMPERVQIENVAFEGFLLRRGVVDAIGLPDPAYYIFYDDVDFAVRARLAGYRIWAVRDAVLVRQLAFDQQHALDSWKGYYMYRNLFAVHFRYGENALVRAKPYAIAAGVAALGLARGRRPEARNVLRGLRDARRMRTRPH
jgi:rhamnopyranosyl-N-acetylglucosaminyl-diphospho-decaprenol beta-1,3/1,4-galactofuranosyltransferase